ncbi:Disease resistance-like protein CSA1 [Linum perenne]
MVDIRECSNLKRLPTKLNSKCLEYVLLSHYPKVTLCPEINSSEVGLQVLDLEETPVMELPSAIHKVKQGGTLRLCGKHITSFPQISTSLELFRLCHTMITNMDIQDDDSSFSESSLPKFDKVELVENSQLMSLPNNIWDMVRYELQLEILTLLGCTMIKSLPQLLPPELKYLHLGGCSSLQTLLSNMWNLNLWILNFENCPQLDYKLANQIVADFHSIPTTMCPESEMNIRTEGELFYSGSELPEWCSSMNCEMELPPPSANNGLAKGIAFGVVFSSDGTEVGQEMKCDVLGPLEIV